MWFACFVLLFVCLKCRGENTRRSNFVNSRSPFYEPDFEWFLRALFLTLFYVHFMMINFMDAFATYQIHSGQGWYHHPYYVYIYSLGHFLTTKGALIDGD